MPLTIAPAEHPPRNCARDPEVRSTSCPCLLTDDAILTAKAHCTTPLTTATAIAADGSVIPASETVLEPSPQPVGMRAKLLLLSPTRNVVL